MTDGADQSDGRARSLFGPIAHLSVLATLAAFLPLSGELLWLLVIPPLALLVVAAYVVTVREREAEPAPADEDRGTHPENATGEPAGQTN